MSQNSKFIPLCKTRAHQAGKNLNQTKDSGNRGHFFPELWSTWRSRMSSRISDVGAKKVELTTFQRFRLVCLSNWFHSWWKANKGRDWQHFVTSFRRSSQASKRQNTLRAHEDVTFLCTKELYETYHHISFVGGSVFTMTHTELFSNKCPQDVFSMKKKLQSNFQPPTDYSEPWNIVFRIGMK